jgi:hypothetical protein
MMPPLAELPAPDSTQAVGWLVVTFFGIMGGLYYTLAVIDKFRGKKPTEIAQPLSVKAHDTGVTRQEWSDADTKVHGRIKRERAEIDERIARVEDEARDRADKLEAKIDKNTELTAAMRGETKQINQNVGLILTAITNNATAARR